MPEALVSALDTITGWTASAGLALELNGHRDLIAGGRSASVAVRIPAGSSGKFVSLPLSFVGSDYSELTLSIASLRSAGWYPIRHLSDARYSIRAAAPGSEEYYVPCGRELSRVSMPIPPAVTALTVTVRHDDDDYLVLSNLVACKDGGPEDLLDAVVGAIEVERDRILGPGREIGTASGDPNDEEVVIDVDWSWVAPGVVLAFETGDDAYEVHQVLNVVDNAVTFNTRFDGASLVTTLTDAAVYVTFPVEVGYYDREADLPGVAVWHDPPAPVERHSRSTVETSCIGVLSAVERHVRRREGATVSWRITIEVAARNPELVGYISQAVRAFLATSELWVHGEKLWFDWRDPPAATEPVEGFDLVPRATYSFAVEVKEDSWAQEEAVPGSPVLSVSPL